MPDLETRVGIVDGIVVRDGRAAQPVVVHLRRRRSIDPPVLLSPLATPHIVRMIQGKLDRLTAV